MWIRIQEEHLRQLAFAKEIRQIFHCIRSQARDVPVFVGGLRPQRLYPIHDIVGHFDANLQAQSVPVGIEFAEGYQKTAIAATDIGEFHLPLADIRI